QQELHDGTLAERREQHDENELRPRPRHRRLRRAARRLRAHAPTLPTAAPGLYATDDTPPRRIPIRSSVDERPGLVQCHRQSHGPLRPRQPPTIPLPGRGCPMTPDHVPTPVHAPWLSRPVRECALVILLLLFVAGTVLLDRSFNYTVLLYGLALVCLALA